MANITSRLENELRRLANGPRPNEAPDSIGTVPFTAHCPGGVDNVLTKVKAVLRIVDEAALKGWPGKDQSAPILPDWFISACAPDITQAQAEQWLEQWRNLEPEEQVKAEFEKGWPLGNWLYWLEPDNREWFWWDATEIEGQKQAALAVEVNDWPFPWGALKWLFHAAGATLVADED